MRKVYIVDIADIVHVVDVNIVDMAFMSAAAGNDRAGLSQFNAVPSAPDAC